MLLYATLGDKFQFGSRITWSIVPDGTSLGGTPSNLISTLNQELGGVSNWLPVIQDAFAQWENYANINLVQVPDSGQATDSGNVQQNSAAFGDIRIGGYVQNGNVLAFTLLPPAANGGSDSGDVFFNTGISWHINSDFDLETVALHEIGHALGLGHSADPNAAMYPYYGGVDQTPNTDDINGIRAVWGGRQEDPVEQMNGNLSTSKAVDLTSFISSSNNQVYMPGLNVASSGESYWFKVTTPSNASSTFTAQVQSVLLSELSPRVQIYNASGNGLVQTAASANSYGAVVTATINNATPNTTYYIRVLGSNAGDTGTGAYALMLNMGSGSIAPATPPNTTVYTQADQGGGGVADKIGGANTKANTTVDIPDQILIGHNSGAANGDYLLASTKKNKKEATHIRLAHPAAPKIEKPSKTSIKVADKKK